MYKKQLSIVSLFSVMAVLFACGDESPKGSSPEEESSSSEEVIQSSSSVELIESSSESESVTSYLYEGPENWSVVPDAIFFGEGNSVGEAYPCDGCCVKYSLKEGAYYPGVKLIFDLPTVLNSPTDCVDVSDWEGICVTYKADHLFYLEQDIPDSLFSISGGTPVFKLAASAEKQTVDAYWNDFKPMSGKGASGQDLVKNVTAINVLVSHLAGTEGKIEIYQIGALGYCK